MKNLAWTALILLGSVATAQTSVDFNSYVGKYQVSASLAGQDREHAQYAVLIKETVNVERLARPLTRYSFLFSPKPIDLQNLKFTKSANFYVDTDGSVFQQYDLNFYVPPSEAQTLSEDADDRYCGFKPATRPSGDLIEMDYCGDSSPIDRLQFSNGSIHYTAVDNGGGDNSGTIIDQVFKPSN